MSTGSALEAEKRLYFCLMCQRVVTMIDVRAGRHRSHLLTEYACTQNESWSDNSLMRMFREKVEQARRYKELMYKRCFS